MADEEKTQGPLKVMSLDVENILRVQAVRLEMGPDGVLQIEGCNEQGKTSLLRALDLLWAGKKAEATPVPLHGDATKGHVSMEVGHLTITKKYREGKGPVLTVTVGRGQKLAKPQTILDDLLAHFTLNPLKFMAMDDKKKLETLAAFLEFDSSFHDAEEARVADERKWAKKDAQALIHALNEAPKHINAPEELVDVKALMVELKKRQEHNATKDEATAEYTRGLHALEELSRQKMCAGNEVKELEAQLAEAQASREHICESQAAKAEELKTVLSARDAIQPMNVEEIETQINQADDLNRKRRDNDRRSELMAQSDAAQQKWDNLEDELKKVREAKDKARASAAAKLPLPDLGLTEDAVTYKGKPLSQAGRSAQLRVSVAVAIAMNEDKQVKLLLIDDAEKLDPEGTKTLLEMAAAANFQVIMTRVMGAGGPSQGAVVIEDGMVKNG